jgi:hypothetical protein
MRITSLLEHSEFICSGFCRSGLLVLCAFLGLAVPHVAAADCQPAPLGLVGWWPGDGNANDIAGTNNGILLGGATATDVGVVGSAFSFDGTNSYVQIADSSVLEPSTLTIEAWVKFSSLENNGANQDDNLINPGHQHIIFKQNTVSNIYQNFGFAYSLGKDRYPHVPIPVNGDGFYFNVMDSNGNYPEAGATNEITTNVWYHIAGVRDVNYIQLYVNGQLQGQVATSGAQYYNGNWPLYFGTTGQSYWDGKLNGSLDEVSIYNRALSSNEIAAVYNAGAAGKCRTLSPVITVGANISSNILYLTFPTQIGPTYCLQCEYPLTAKSWQAVTNVAGTGGPMTLSIPIGSLAMQYFRLLVL